MPTRSPRRFKTSPRSLQPYIIKQRRHFHKHPELSLQEVRTTSDIAGQLDAMNIPYGSHSRPASLRRCAECAERLSRGRHAAPAPAHARRHRRTARHRAHRRRIRERQRRLHARLRPRLPYRHDARRPTGSAPHDRRHPRRDPRCVSAFRGERLRRTNDVRGRRMRGCRRRVCHAYLERGRRGHHQLRTRSAHGQHRLVPRGRARHVLPRRHAAALAATP